MPDLKNSFLMRNGQPLRIDFQRLLSMGDLSQNVYLQSDDFLSFAFGGACLHAGAVASRTNPYSDRLSRPALASAAGRSNMAGCPVAIVRGSLTAPRIALVDYKAIYLGKAPDVQLEPGDIVYVRCRLPQAGLDGGT
jgi:hypothetical protein